MSAGVLEFTLGMAAGGFNRAIEESGGKLKEFMGHAAKVAGIGIAMEAGIAALHKFGNVVEGVMGVIEHGAGLAAMSKVTGESVKNLFLMERGLRAVGLGSEGASSMVFKLQKSLGGVNEEGLPTSHIFAQLGLQIDNLRGMDAPQAVMAIARSMERLDNASAAAAAGAIFGREGARNFLQLARSAGEFSAALKENQKAAAQMDRNAETFHKLEVGMGRLKTKGENLFAGIAEGVAPALKGIIDMLDSIDLSEVGNQIGQVMGAFVQAFKEGKLMDLVVDSFKFAFEVVVAMAPAILGKLGIFLLKMFETPLEYLQAGMEYVIQKIMEGLAKIPKLNEWMGIKDFKAESFGDILKSRKESGAELFSQGNTVQNMGEGVDQFYEQQKAKVAELARGYGAEIGKFNSRVARPKEETPAKGQERLEAAYKPERTAIEKMGFVFGGTVVQDHQATTARNTTKMVAQLEKLVGGRGAAGSQPALQNAHPA